MRIFVASSSAVRSPILFVFRLELLDEFFELTLFSVDLLLKQVGTVLQVATDVTH
jgi:hypothetical protein